MSRRKLFAYLAALLPTTLLAQEAKNHKLLRVPQGHEHEWVVGPFYFTVAVSFEEPQYYHPSGLSKFEFCKGCGIMRVPNNALRYAGKENESQ